MKTDKYTSFLKSQKTSKKTERGDLLEKFLQKVNNERKGTKYKPMTMKLLAIKLSHVKTADLYYLDSVCKDYENRSGSYSKCLFGSLKVKE